MVTISGLGLILRNYLMEFDNLMEKLFSCSSKKYGPKYIDHLFEQYKLYVESAEKISDRRHIANTFFLSLHTVLISTIGYILGSESFLIVGDLIIFAGILLAFVWRRLVFSYRQMNTGKFKVIHSIEKRLPLALYSAEWEALGAGKDTKKYLPFSHVERFIPYIFAGVYIFLWIVIHVNLLLSIFSILGDFFLKLCS